MSATRKVLRQPKRCLVNRLFEPGTKPRVFGLAPGVDFPKALVAGLRERLDGSPPDAMARVDLIVNTARMQRRITDLFSEGPPGFLPRLRLLTMLDGLVPEVFMPQAASPLRCRLELVKLVSKLLEADETLAPRTSLYDLTDSLAALFDEMHGEGVSPEAISALDLSDHSDHWSRAQKFIGIAREFLRLSDMPPDAETRRRAMVQALAAHWHRHPPAHPVIVAGSTGSRGATLLLMETVARLPQGALILPGFDHDTPFGTLSDGSDGLPPEDHPQFRFQKLMLSLGIGPDDVAPWHDTPPPSPTRNRLVSLSLRPAPVTDAWRIEGRRLTDMEAATEGVTLLEAPTPRAEALAIALRLRKAAEDGQRAAVITPHRMLTRQITAALDQWGILPDDSAGTPLQLSPPGRFLRHVAALFHRRLDAEALLSLLKHPLTHSGKERGAHVLNTQRLELEMRKHGLPYPDPEGIRRMVAGVSKDAERQREIEDWADWVGEQCCGRLDIGDRPLERWVNDHRTLAECLALGRFDSGTGGLWEKQAGREALRTLDHLAEHAPFGGAMSAQDYADLIGALLAEGEVRDRDAPHPDIMIWGTLEARVQGADLVILAGLNDGTWPEPPAPDPWLNRTMRHKAGLLLPERRIGLSAHDYQQAIGAREVWLSRSIRSDDAQTIASRWVNRLCNLLGGLEEQGGKEALTRMIHRGNIWLQHVATYETAPYIPPAPRPSPKPPAAARPRQLSVTDIKHLIRDPYAIYAKRVLRLRKLGSLVQTPDALLRGRVAHEVVEEFVKESLADPSRLSPEVLASMAEEILRTNVPWPAARTLWQARLLRIADAFVAGETERQSRATPVAFEEQARGKLNWPEIGFSLTVQADRIDRTNDGKIILYDYKTGTPPSEKEQATFDKQLLIEAAMIEQGAFPAIGPAEVLDAVFIGLGLQPKDVKAPLADEPPHEVLQKLRELIEAYLDPQQGFTSRRMMQKVRFDGDYDLLARFGEWEETDSAVPEVLE